MFVSLIMYRIVCLKEPPILLSLAKPCKTDRPANGPRKKLDPIAVRDGGSFMGRMERSTCHLKVGMEFHMGNSMMILRRKKENNEVLGVFQVNNTVETRIT